MLELCAWYTLVLDYKVFVSCLLWLRVLLRLMRVGRGIYILIDHGDDGRD